MDFERFLGYAAGALTVAALVPQSVRAWRTRETHDLSWAMLAVLMVANGAWIAYGTMRGDGAVIGTNSGSALVNASLMVAKARFK